MPTPRKRTRNQTKGKVKPLTRPRVATQEVHFMRVLRQASKIRTMREQLKSLTGEALRSYLISEFGRVEGSDAFARFSERELHAFRDRAIAGCNEWLRDAGKGKR